MMLPSGPSPAGGRLIADGDLVIVYERFDSMKSAVVNVKKGQLQNRHGNFLHRDWVGKSFGTKVYSQDGRGFIYLLAPTPELWTQVLKHRTQILYAGDISLVCMNLDLRPGSVVLESGTGSGSLSTSLSRSVGPDGKVMTFEFHKERSEIAAEEFKSNGLANIAVTHRNIEEDGFPAELHGCADGVFLDLPGPWKVVESANACLKEDGCFCSFSPCIEQVQRTCEALSDHGFRDIKTVEILLRYYRVNTEKLVTDLDSFDAPTRGLSSTKGSRSNQGRKRRKPDAAAEEVAEQSSSLQALATCRPEESARGHTGYLTFARSRVIVKDLPCVDEAAE